MNEIVASCSGYRQSEPMSENVKARDELHRRSWMIVVPGRIALNDGQAVQQIYVSRIICELIEWLHIADLVSANQQQRHRNDCQQKTIKSRESVDGRPFACRNHKSYSSTTIF